MKTKNVRINLVVLALIILGISTRFFIDIPNFTAIGAIALFSGAFFTNRKLAFTLPIALLLITDIFLGFHNTMLFVYIPFMLLILIGFLLKQSTKPLHILAASIAGSVIFFIISNFGVWITGMGISPTLIGVYTDGLPFFRNTLASDLIFNAIFFTSVYFVFEKTSLLKTVNE